MRTRNTNRRGSTMVIALVLIVVLTATAAAALTTVSSERRVVEDQQAAVDAHAMARSGYDQFITDPMGAFPGFVPATFVGPESTQYTFSDGYAWVSIQRVRPSVSGSSILFLIRSRAVRTANRPGNIPVAERTFAQYAQWQTGSMNTLAAWTSLTGLTKEFKLYTFYTMVDNDTNGNYGFRTNTPGLDNKSFAVGARYNF